MFMSQVIVYTTSYCPYCSRAKQFLKSMGVDYKEVNVEDDEALREEMSNKYNWQTVPMIVVNGNFIGGYDDMMRLHAQGKFAPLLQA